MRILWYQGITVLDSAAELLANATCDCRDFTHRCITAKSDYRLFDITWCITTMVLFFFFVQGSTSSTCCLIAVYAQNLSNSKKVSFSLPLPPAPPSLSLSLSLYLFMENVFKLYSQHEWSIHQMVSAFISMKLVVSVHLFQCFFPGGERRMKWEAHNFFFDDGTFQAFRGKNHESLCVTSCSWIELCVTSFPCLHRRWTQKKMSLVLVKGHQKKVWSCLA